MVYDPPAIYGIIGNPVAHSLSPKMHNAAFMHLKVNATYKLFPLADKEELKLFMEDLKEKENPIFGLNVTVPYKEDVLPYIDVTDPLSEKIGAVNTLVISHERRIMGYNTDGPGFLTHLIDQGFDPRNKRIAILGAGGTTRAILSILCLLQERPTVVKLYNRTKAKAQAIIDDIGSRIDTSIIEVVDDIDDLNIEIADLLINTTTVGMKTDDPMLVGADSLHSNLFVYDVIYAPIETALLKTAKAKGAKTANGLGMLYYQGVLAFQHWAECELDDKVKKVMVKALQDSVAGNKKGKNNG